MCNNFPNIRITEGNNFSLVLPLRSRTYVATKPIDEDIDPEQLENVVVTFGGVEYPAQRTAQGVQIDLPSTLAVGTYNILLTADYLESSIRAAYESAVTIVPWSAQSTAEQYIAGSPIVMRAAYVLSCVLTDAELEALKQEAREKIAEAERAKEEAEQAKAEWEQKAADLDGVAQEATLEAVGDKIGSPAQGQPSTLFAAIAATGGDEQGKQDIVDALVGCGVDASMTDTLTTLANKITDNLRCAIYGTKLYESPDPTQMVDAGWLNWDNIEHLDTRSRAWLGNSSYYTKGPFSIRDMPRLKSVVGDVLQISEGFGQNCNALLAVIFPKCTSIRLINVYSDFFMQTVSAIRHIHTGSISILLTTGYSWHNSSNSYLYDVKLHMGVSVSISFSAWKPTNAINSALTTITDVDQWDDPDQPVFNNNLEKFLWYFENHFIPSFNTVTNSPTLTLSASVYNVANANYSAQDPTKTLLQLIEDKGWTVASV